MILASSITALHKTARSIKKVLFLSSILSVSLLMSFVHHTLQHGRLEFYCLCVSLWIDIKKNQNKLKLFFCFFATSAFWETRLHSSTINRVVERQRSFLLSRVIHWIKVQQYPTISSRHCFWLEFAQRHNRVFARHELSSFHSHFWRRRSFHRERLRFLFRNRSYLWRARKEKAKRFSLNR